MLELIKKRAQLDKENLSMLWAEIVIFSILSGFMCHNFLVSGIIFIPLACLLNKPNGMFWMIFAISLIWGLLAAGIALEAGGLAAVISGVIVFLMGVKVHVNGLKWYWDEMIYKYDDTIELKRTKWMGKNACWKF